MPENTSIPKLLTVAQVAEILGRSEASVRWMINQGTAPKSAKIPGLGRMFRESDVIAWIDAAFEAGQ
jgi:predicted DNA-binding transcriptional regulator AlpA